jgi:predicted XRE-type DNA-binding protein
MRENCGIIALDALLKSLNMNMSRISLDTLCKICRDNGKLMYPLRVPKSKLLDLGFPYVLQTNNHYETIEDEIALDGLVLPEHVYLLYPILIPQVIPFVIDEEESKEVKGACVDKVKDIPIVGPFISKPARLIPMFVGAGTQMLGGSPALGNILSTASGAGQGMTTGLWGEPGAGSMLKGAGAGLGLGMVGRGIGGGLSNVLNTPQALTTPGYTGFLGGFKQGLGSSIPFGQRLGLYRPETGISNVGSLAGITKGGVYNVPGYASPIVATGESFSGGGGGKPPITNLGQNVFGAGKGGYAGGNLLPGSQQGTQQGGANNLLSYLLMGAGGLMPNPSPKGLPTSQDVIANYQNIKGQTSPEGQAAQAKIMQYINAPESIGGAATTNYISALNNDLATRESNELSTFRADWEARGYNPYGSDYTSALQDLQDKQANRRDLLITQVRQQLLQQQINAQLQMISTAYGVDQQMLSDLLNLDVQEAAIKYGMDVERVNQFRQAIYNIALTNVYGNMQKQGNQQLATGIGNQYGTESQIYQTANQILGGVR